MSEHERQVGEIPASFDSEACPIKASKSGYLQAIDDEELIKIAKSKDLLLRLKYRPGKFVVQGSDLVMVWPGERVNQKLTDQINDAFILGKELDTPTARSRGILGSLTILAGAGLRQHQ